jgi:hypothetical protein
MLKKLVCFEMFGPRREEVPGGGRKLHNNELHNLRSSTKYWRTNQERWTGHVARWYGKYEMHTKF